MERLTADWVLAAEDRTVPEVRARVAQALYDLPDEALETALLLTSEVVTNAVRHATGPLRVRVSRSDHGVRVEVDDQSPEVPVVQAPDLDAPSGRGLLIVDGLSSGWGVEPGDAGKTVWFALDA